MAGKDQVWDAALKQTGIIRVNDIEELTDTIRTLYKLPLMKGRRVGVVSFTGGFGVMGIDACQKYGLEVARFSSQTVHVLQEMLPPWQGVGNPVDLGPTVMVRKTSARDTVEAAMKTLLDDPGVDAVLGIFGAFTPSAGQDYYQVTERAIAQRPGKPVVFYFYGPFGAEAWKEFQPKNNTAAFLSPDRAARALGHLADYSDFRTRS